MAETKQDFHSNVFVGIWYQAARRRRKRRETKKNKGEREKEGDREGVRERDRESTGVKVKTIKWVIYLAGYGVFCFNCNTIIATTVVYVQIPYIAL